MHVYMHYSFFDCSTQESGEVDVSKACLVVCVVRVNAVWQLKHCLAPLMEQQRRSTNARSSVIHCELAVLAIQCLAMSLWTVCSGYFVSGC